MTATRLISQREAAALLAPTGCAASRARRVFAAGLAGPMLRTRGALLLEADRVRDLAAWPTLAASEVDGLCPQGMLVLRMAHRRSVDVLRPWSEQADAIGPAWPISMWSSVRVSLAADHVPNAASGLPVLGTVCGFVAFGADLRAVRAREHDADLDLDPPGPWFAGFERRRFPTPPGTSWLLWRRTWAEEIARGIGRPLSPPR